MSVRIGSVSLMGGMSGMARHPHSISEAVRLRSQDHNHSPDQTPIHGKRFIVEASKYELVRTMVDDADAFSIWRHCIPPPPPPPSSRRI